MPDSMSSDFSELMTLSQDLGQVSSLVGPFIRSAVEFTSTGIKKTAQKSVAKGGKRWSRAAGAIDYELTVEAGLSGSSISSDIGYNEEKVLPTKAVPLGSKRETGPGTAGNLGRLREYGAPGADGIPLAPHNDLLNALKANEKDFEHGLSEALKDAERAAGL